MEITINLSHDRRVIVYDDGTTVFPIVLEESGQRITTTFDEIWFNWEDKERPFISDGKARRIASEWHGGQGSALYSFTSTGTITDDLVSEIRSELVSAILGTNIEERKVLQDLLTYAKAHGMRGPVEGWSSVWE